MLKIDQAAAPLNPTSTAYIYQNRKEEDSDAESLIDEFWGLDMHDDSEDEEDEEEEDVGDEEEDNEEDVEAGDLPEDLNARCKIINYHTKGINWHKDFLARFISILQ